MPVENIAMSTIDISDKDYLDLEKYLKLFDINVSALKKSHFLRRIKTSFFN